MFSIFTKITLFFILTVGLQAQSGFSQNHLLSVSPEASMEGVSADETIEIEFDLPINTRSVKRHTIMLKNVMDDGTHKKIEGSTTLKNETTLLFIPSEALKSGVYDVKVKKVKLLDYTINTRFKRFAKKMCSYFYDDITECRLYRYASSVKTKKINYSFKVDDASPSVTSIVIDRSYISRDTENIYLEDDNQTTLKVMATYDDNTTKDVTDIVEWIISDNSILSISKNIITPLNEGVTNIQAKYHNETSQVMLVTVYKVVSGYWLPPEPDAALNSSTLLGIDTNNNGIRDDIERWILLEMEIYNGYENIEHVIAMQEAKAFQMALIDPTNKDDRVHQAIQASSDCWMYYRYSRNLPFQSGSLKFSRAIKDKMFNTKERLRTYWQYDSTLAGRVFTSTPTLKTKYQCRRSIDGL